MQNGAKLSSIGESSMKTRRLFLILTVLLTICSSSVFATPPPNLTCAKRAVMEYYNSGEFEKDVSTVVKDAEKYLLQRVAENTHSSKKLALVLDIDETSLTNFQGNKKNDFSGLSQVIDHQYREETATAIKPVLHLFNEAIKNHVTVFFISFRPDEVRSHTISNLEKAGYAGWKILYLPKSEELKLGAATYKTDIRRMLTEQGYDIILNVGDQDTDLVGGFADHTDKIPNPLYSTSPICDKNICALKKSLY